MDMKAFSDENVARCVAPNGFNHPLDGWSLSDWMVATMGELGEAANVLKKLNRVPGFSLDKDSWGDVPNNKTMAAKYFLDIMNEGTSEMVEGARMILKAMWMRLAMPTQLDISDDAVGEAMVNWFTKVSPTPMPADVKVITKE